MRKTDHTKGKHGNAFKPKKFAKKPKSGRNLYQTRSRLGDVEKKNVDVVNSGILCPANAAFRVPILCNPIQQGSGPSNRLGRRVTFKSFQIRYTVGRSSGSGPSQVRFLVVYDRQSNAATPTNTDILLIDRFDSPMNLANADRFVVLIDEVSESRQSTSLNISGQRYVKMALDGLYTANLGTSADYTQGAIYLLIASNDESAGTDTTPVDCVTRIRYVDV